MNLQEERQLQCKVDTGSDKIVFSVKGGNPNDYEPIYWNRARQVESDGPIKLKRVLTKSVLIDLSGVEDRSRVVKQKVCNTWKLSLPYPLPDPTEAHVLANFLGNSGAPGTFFPLFRSVEAKSSSEIIYLEETEDTVDILLNYFPQGDAFIERIWPNRHGSLEAPSGFSFEALDEVSQRFYFSIRHKFESLQEENHQVITLHSDGANGWEEFHTPFSALEAQKGYIFSAIRT